MPRLSELLKRPENIKEGTSVPLSTLQKPETTMEGNAPPANVNLRCPMPSIGTVSPDALRQFYSTNAPKFRVLTQK